MLGLFEIQITIKNIFWKFLLKSFNLTTRVFKLFILVLPKTKASRYACLFVINYVAFLKMHFPTKLTVLMIASLTLVRFVFH